MILYSLITLLSSCNSLPKVITRTEKSTFTIYTYDEYGVPNGSGSGFFIDKKGVGVTNYHVLDKTVKAYIRTQNGKEYQIDKVIASDKEWDIVKFTINNPVKEVFTPLTLYHGDLKQGNRVMNIGSPLGYQNSISDGIISAIRKDRHGQILQVTSEILPGSSGSPIINHRSEVMAVATYSYGGNRNLDFGVVITPEKLAALKSNPFPKENPNFNNNANFVILNAPERKGDDLVLNAIEYTPKQTILYFTYTHLNLFWETSMLWCDLKKKFYLQTDLSDEKYFASSSTLTSRKMDAEPIHLGECVEFRVFFPPIQRTAQKLDVVWGNDSRAWCFQNIALNKKEQLQSFDAISYEVNKALSSIASSDLDMARSTLLSALERDPKNLQILSALGVVCYRLDKDSDAISYLKKVCELNPLSENACMNLSVVYEYHKQYDKALEEINRAIAISPDQPDYYMNRIQLMLKIDRDPETIQEDLKRLESSEDFKNDPSFYEIRAEINHQYFKNNKETCRDIKKANQMTIDKEQESRLTGMWKSCGCDRLNK